MHKAHSVVFGGDDAIYRANGHAGLIDNINTGAGYYVSHGLQGRRKRSLAQQKLKVKVEAEAMGDSYDS